MPLMRRESDPLNPLGESLVDSLHSIDPSNAAITPHIVIAGNGTLVHSATFRPTGGPAFSRAQQNNIAEKVTDALLTDPDTDKRSPSTSSLSTEDEATSAKVSAWIVDNSFQDVPLDHPDVQQPDLPTVDGPPTDEEIEFVNKHITREDWDPRAHHPDSIVPDMEDNSDIEDFDLDEWVKVGEEDEVDDFIVPMPSMYKYKKADAKSGRKGWFQGWFY